MAYLTKSVSNTIGANFSSWVKKMVMRMFSSVAVFVEDSIFTLDDYGVRLCIRQHSKLHEAMDEKEFYMAIREIFLLCFLTNDFRTIYDLDP